MQKDVDLRVSMKFCDFCLDETRDGEKFCIVQSAKDIFIIEDSKL